jgi:predicted phage baseplate assembly protein
MSGVWWGRGGWQPERGRMVPGSGPGPSVPELVRAARQATAGAARARIRGYTPEWAAEAADPDDAGEAFIRLYAELMEPVLERANRLPERQFVEFLRTAGVRPLVPSPATALLRFEIAGAAPEPVVIPRGFQVGAAPATGSGDLVIFETRRTLTATPARLAELHVEQARQFLQLASGTEPDPAFRFPPFGERPRLGNALYLGFSGNVPPGPMLSLGIRVAVAAGDPPPQQAGGVAPLPVPPPPFLTWHLLDGSAWRPADVVFDDTGGLLRTGVVELRLPRRWRTGRPAGMAAGASLYWLRLRLGLGTWSTPPVLSWVLPNMVPADAGRTIRDEVLEPVPGTRGRSYRLSQTPVLSGSLVLEVAESGFDEVRDAEPAAVQPEDVAPATAGVARWRRVDSLALAGPDDRAYELEPATGVVRFGDGRHGAVLPPGFRHVRARAYRVGGGAAGAVDADAVKVLVSSVRHVEGVSNPLPAFGGAEAETAARTLRRGPEEIRARGRAVTTADYALMALRSTGTRVARAHAAAGLHPSYPGVPIPGVVTVFVVPPPADGGPPVLTEGELRGVAESLSRGLAPLGVEVVAAAPRYRRVRTEVGIVVDPAVDAARAAALISDRIDGYLDPLRGGPHGDGWAFGAPLIYTDLLRQLVLPASGIRAVPRLTLVIDGVRRARCTDVVIGPHELFWPEQHEVIPEEGTRS